MGKWKNETSSGSELHREDDMAALSQGAMSSGDRKERAGLTKQSNRALLCTGCLPIQSMLAVGPETNVQEPGFTVQPTPPLHNPLVITYLTA